MDTIGNGSPTTACPSTMDIFTYDDLLVLLDRIIVSLLCRATVGFSLSEAKDRINS